MDLGLHVMNINPYPKNNLYRIDASIIVTQNNGGFE